VFHTFPVAVFPGKRLVAQMVPARQCQAMAGGEMSHILFALRDIANPLWVYDIFRLLQ